MKTLTALLFGFTSLSILAASPDTFFGQSIPDQTPQVFAPGTVSTNNWEMNGAFSQDMKTYYFVREVEIAKSMTQQFVALSYENNQLKTRVISPRVGHPFVSPDGNTLHLGKRFMQKTANGWSTIKSLNSDFESYRIMSLTASLNGTYAFDDASKGADGLLYYSKLHDGQRQRPMPFPDVINTGQYNAHPFIAPDESYIIWDGQRNSDVRNANLFISFKQANGTWGRAIEMGPDINTPAAEFGAKVTPDGKYLFFSRNQGNFEWVNHKGEIEEIPNIDIFWVDAVVIQNLKEQSTIRQ